MNINLKEIIIASAVLVFFVLQGLSNAESIGVMSFTLPIKQGLIFGMVAFIFTFASEMLTKSKKQNIKYKLFIAICFFVGGATMLLKSFNIGTQESAYGFVFAAFLFASGMIVGVLTKKFTGYRYEA